MSTTHRRSTQPATSSISESAADIRAWSSSLAFSPSPRPTLSHQGLKYSTPDAPLTWGCTIDLSRPLHKSSPFVSTATEATDEDHHRFIESGSRSGTDAGCNCTPIIWSGRQQGETDARKINYTGSRTRVYPSVVQALGHEVIRHVGELRIRLGRHLERLVLCSRFWWTPQSRHQRPSAGWEVSRNDIAEAPTIATLRNSVVVNRWTFWEGGVNVACFLSGPALPQARRGTVWPGLAHVSDW